MRSLLQERKNIDWADLKKLQICLDTFKRR